MLSHSFVVALCVLLCCMLSISRVANARPFSVPIPTLVKSSTAHLFEKFNAKNDPTTAKWTAAGVNSMKFDTLKTSGQAARTPWPGSYWPSYKDSINFRWAGKNSVSPAGKYAKAFLTNPQYSSAQVTDAMQKFEDQISEAHGVGVSGDPQSCSADNQCGGRYCGFRTMVNSVEPQSSGVCVDGWAGICHGWAPAALAEAEPQRAVSFNNVVFQIPDVKALLSAAYTASQSLPLGFKCDLGGGGNADSAGRLTDLTCRDTNPGAFHVVIANLLGSGKSLVEDKTYDLEIWNQPIKGFQSTSSDIEFAAAHKKLGLGSVPATPYYYNDKAVKLKYVKMTLDYVNECASAESGVLAGHYISSDVYEYIVELDAGGAVIGGEWLPTSQRNHPDFLWAMSGIGAPAAQDLKVADAQWLNSLTQLSPSTNVCANNNGGCHSKATCSSSVQGQVLSVSCVCKSGYTGNGRNCTGSTPEPNACDTNNGGCPTDSTCSLDPGGQVHCTCFDGLYLNTNVQPNVCSDINECTNNNGGCAQVCTNTYRSFSCSCFAGYTQSGSTCTDIDECRATSNPCPDVHSSCLNTPGSFECPCNSGYVRVTPTASCTKEQPPIFKNCSDPLSNTCDPTTSTCVDTGPGSYYCKCLPGYTAWTNAQGKTFCVPIDPCANHNGGCHVQATCARLSNGTVQCTCFPGLYGDGHLCYPAQQRPVVLDVTKCQFSVGCPALDATNTTLGSAMREDQHVMLLFNRFTVVRTTTSAKLPLNCQFSCVMPLTKGWSVDLTAATLSGSTTLVAGGTLRGFVDMWLSGSTPNTPSLDLLVANQGFNPTTTPFTAHRNAAAGDPQQQGSCAGDAQVILRGWMALQFSGAVGSSFTINSMDASIGEYDWNGAGFDWQMTWKKC